MNTTTIALFLMSEKGWKSLNGIIEAGLSKLIEFVITSKDKNIQYDYHDEIVNLCNNNNITLFDKKDHYKITSKYAIAISWRWLIPLQEYKLIILHDSLLPKYRGFSPLVNALINGDKYIGITALYGSTNYDEGDIIFQEKIKIQYPIKISEAISLVSIYYTEIIIKIFSTIAEDKYLISYKQNHKEATYSLWRSENDYFIDWRWSASKIKRFVDAVSFPYNRARAILDNIKIIVDEVEVVEDVIIENRDVGKIIFMKDNLPIIVCGEGLIMIQKAVNASNGCNIFPLMKFRSIFT